MKLPDPYDGTPDWRAFQKWAIYLAHFAEVNKYSDRAMLLMMLPFVKGKVEEFYLDHVANKIDD